MDTQLATPNESDSSFMQDISTMRHLQAIRDRLSMFEQAHPEFPTGEIPILASVETDGSETND